ncbi:MAG: YbdD/YjiX family protein [Methylophilaceae bacterium]
MTILRKIWRIIRRLSGDDAYERYVAHHTHHHEGVPLSREAYFKQWQDGKWQGVKRCC